MVQSTISTSIKDMVGGCDRSGIYMKLVSIRTYLSDLAVSPSTYYMCASEEEHVELNGKWPDAPTGDPTLANKNNK